MYALEDLESVIRTAIMDFIDDGDLSVTIKESKRIEIKNLSAQFTCAEDWPYKDFMVCEHMICYSKAICLYDIQPNRTHIRF